MNSIKPMGWSSSILYFGIPAFLFAFFFYVVQPIFLRNGVNTFYANLISLTIPLLMLGIGAIVGFFLEQGKVSFEGILQRFRFAPLRGKDWLVMAIVFAVEMLLFVGFNLVNQKLLGNGFYPIPKGLSGFSDQRVSVGMNEIDTMVGGLKGNWGVALFVLVVLLINVVGEELWWRGFIYPRQALFFGSSIWIVHGLMWTFSILINIGIY